MAYVPFAPVRALTSPALSGATVTVTSASGRPVVASVTRTAIWPLPFFGPLRGWSASAIRRGVPVSGSMSMMPSGPSRRASARRASLLARLGRTQVRGAQRQLRTEGLTDVQVAGQRDRRRREPTRRGRSPGTGARVRGPRGAAGTGCTTRRSRTLRSSSSMLNPPFASIPEHDALRYRSVAGSSRPPRDAHEDALGVACAVAELGVLAARDCCGGGEEGVGVEPVVRPGQAARPRLCRCVGED